MENKSDSSHWVVWGGVCVLMRQGSLEGCDGAQGGVMVECLGEGGY